MKLSEIPSRTFFIGTSPNGAYGSKPKLYFKAYRGVYCVDPLENSNPDFNHDITDNVEKFDPYIKDYKPVEILIQEK